jgi:hypothetical protein
VEDEGVLDPRVVEWFEANPMMSEPFEDFSPEMLARDPEIARTLITHRYPIDDAADPRRRRQGVRRHPSHHRTDLTITQRKHDAVGLRD